jgi:hypothetical protein
MGEITSLATVAERASSVELYLDMMKLSLTDGIYWDDPFAVYAFYQPGPSTPSWKRYGFDLLRKFLNRYKMQIVRPYSVPWIKDFSRFSKKELLDLRLEGDYWPVRAHTMVGPKRLDNIQFCVETAINDGIPGDLIETGVWRGGSCIFMRSILKAYGDTARTVWVADSFAGLPPPNATVYNADAESTFHTHGDFLAVSRPVVEENFRRYNLLDQQVRFLEGWFKDTLPGAPIDRLAILRLDGDMYESTIQVLESLYHKLSRGGFLIIDDYHLGPCNQAVTDFRSENRIRDTIIDIDGKGAFWRKS